VTRACPSCSAPAPRAASRFCPACGTSLTEAPAWRRVRLPGGLLATRRRRLLVLGAAAAAVLLPLAVVRTPQVLASDPAEPVEEAVAALEEGDAPTVMEAVGRKHPDVFDLAPDVEGGILGAEALKEGYTPPEASLGEVGEARTLTLDDHQRPAGTARTVPVHYRLGGTEDTALAEVVRGRTGWRRPWELNPGGQAAFYGAIELPERPIGDLTIADVTYETGPGILPPGQATALIGTYDVVLHHPLFTDAPTRIDVLPGATTLLEPRPAEIAPDVAEEIADQVAERITGCAEEATDLRPTGCPLRHDPGHYFPLKGDAEWSIEELPEIELAVAEDLTLGAPITVETTTPGEATVEFALSDGETRTATVEVAVAGTVDLDEGGRPRWKP